MREEERTSNGEEAGEEVERAEKHAVSRRDLLATGAAGLGGLSLIAALAACGGGNSGTETAAAAKVGESSAAAAGSTSGAAPDAGPRRKIVWAIAAIGDWNLPIDVGFFDAADQVGWDYQKVGLPLAQYSPENVVNVINRAALTKPDVLVTSWWVKGVGPALEEARDAGILVMANDSDNFPDDRNSLGIPWYGASHYLVGNIVGPAILEAATKQGRTDGTVIGGNPFPGNANHEQALKGLSDSVEAFNRDNGTSFEYEAFPDKADTDPAQAVGLYKAKLTQLGDVAGMFAASSNSTTAMIKALQEDGRQPGEVPVGCNDTPQIVLQQIEEGWAVATADEQSYLAGYVPTFLAWQQLDRGFTSRDYVTGPVLVTADNVASVTERQVLIEEKAGEYGVKLS